MKMARNGPIRQRWMAIELFFSSYPIPVPSPFDSLWPSPLSPSSADTTPSPSDTIPLCPSDSCCPLLFPLLLPPPPYSL
jgi:hypothetical protein